MPETPPSKKPVQGSKKTASRSCSNSPATWKTEVSCQYFGESQTNWQRSWKDESGDVQRPDPHPYNIFLALTSPDPVKTTAATFQHLSHLTTEAATPFEVNCTLTTDTTAVFKPSQVQDDSDMDLETGESSVPTKPSPEPSKLVYKVCDQRKWIFEWRELSQVLFTLALLSTIDLKL